MKLFALLILLISFKSYGINTVAEGFEIVSGGTKTISAHGYCRKVTNLTSWQAFIPTMTSPEWTAFFNNPAPGITAAPCCSGYLYNGYCYYLSAFEQSCDAVCAIRGGCLASGLSYAIITSPAACQQIVTGTSGFSAYTNASADYDMTGYDPLDKMGCVFYDGRIKTTPYSQATRLTGATPTCAATPGAGAIIRRTCPCVY